RKTSDSFFPYIANPPKPWIVPQIAIDDTSRIEVATPRGPKRNAAQTSSGIVICPQGRARIAFVKSGVEIVTDSKPKKASRAVNSNQRRVFHRSSGFSTQLKMSGVTINAPTPSPDHHVNHNQLKSDHDSDPETQRVRLPTVAAIAVLTIAAKPTNFNTSKARLKGFRDSTN